MFHFVFFQSLNQFGNIPCTTYDDKKAQDGEHANAYDKHYFPEYGPAFNGHDSVWFLVLFAPFDPGTIKIL